MCAEGVDLKKTNLNGSETHRQVWNQTADEMGVPLRWVKDSGKLHKIDVELGDIEISKEDRAKFGLSPAGAIRLTPSLWMAIEDVNRILEASRQRLVAESLSLRKDVVSYVSISHLTDGEKKLLKFLLEQILPLVDELRYLQLDPRFPEWKEKIRAGDVLSHEQWERRLDDKCYDTITDPRCSLFPDFPNRRPQYDESPVWTTIPADITKADEEVMKASWKGDPNRNPFYSPFTVVERDSAGGLKWTPMSIHPKTSKIIGALSDALDGASRTEGIAPSLAKQLKLWGEALKGREPYPFDDAERATVWQDDGNLEISIDVSPSYTSFGKAGIQMVGGVVRPGEASFAKKYVGPLLQPLENRLGELVDIYKSRTVRGDIPVRFIDTVIRDANIQQTAPGEVLAYAFPVGTKVSQEEGVAKRVVLMNHNILKFENVYIPLAAASLDPKQLSLVTRKAVETFNLVHEMSHGVGPQHGTVTLEGGTVSQDLGALNDRIEETKADTGGLTIIPYLLKAGSIDSNLMEAVAVSYVVGLIRQMRFGGRLHGGSAAMSFGYLYDKGAISIVEANGEKRFHVNVDKIYPAVEGLWARVVEMQMRGDAEAVRTFMDNHSKKIPDLMDEMTSTFATLNIPRDLKIHYRLVE